MSKLSIISASGEINPGHGYISTRLPCPRRLPVFAKRLQQSVSHLWLRRSSLLLLDRHLASLFALDCSSIFELWPGLCARFSGAAAAVELRAAQAFRCRLRHRRNWSGQHCSGVPNGRRTEVILMWVYTLTSILKLTRMVSFPCSSLRCFLQRERCVVCSQRFSPLVDIPALPGCAATGQLPGPGSAQRRTGAGLAGPGRPLSGTTRAFLPRTGSAV